MPTFQSLQKKYGDVVAYAILLDTERHLHLDSSKLASVDPEHRFRTALTILDQPASLKMCA